jgi:hypothetical protein
MAIGRGTQIQAPRSRGSALGKALGVGQTVLGIAAAPFTGGASLLGVPGGLSAASGGQNQALGQLSQASGLAKIGLDASQLSGDTAKQQKEVASAIESKAGFKTDQPSAIGRQLQGQQIQQNPMQIAQQLSAGEQELNELAKTNPQLANELRQPLFQGMMKFKQDLGQGRFG